MIKFLYLQFFTAQFGNELLHSFVQVGERFLPVKVENVDLPVKVENVDLPVKMIAVSVLITKLKREKLKPSLFRITEKCIK